MSAPQPFGVTPENLASAKAGAMAYAKRQREPTPVIDWDAVIKRFHAMMAELYSDED